MHTPLILATNLIGLGLVTRAMVHLRTHELALLAGRVPPDVSQADYEQAKRDVTGESDPGRQEAMLDLPHTATHWDPPAGFNGTQGA